MPNAPGPQPTTSGEAFSVRVGGESVSGRALGQGRPIVLVHSLLADRTSFEPLAALLASTHRVLMIDLPGFGGSRAVSGGLDSVADRLASAAREFAAGAGRKPIVLGNGYGGFATLLMAIRQPDVAERIVLADCGAAFDEAGRQAFRNMSAAARAKGLGAIADVAMRRLFAPEFQAAHPDLMEHRRSRFLAVDPETFHAACAALASLDLRVQASSVQVPALVVVGEQDEATPPPMSRELANLLPNAQFVQIAGCAHVPQLQDPGRFLQAIRDFLAD